MPLPDELQRRVDERLRAFDEDSLVARIWAKDHTVWKPDPTEISDRLGWLDLTQSMRPHLDEVRRFVDDVSGSGIDRLVLFGMGGSSLAPQVFANVVAVDAARFGVLDSTHPATVLEAAGSLDPSRTLFIVASKSGGTIETLSHFRYFFDRLPDGSHFAAITDPGTPLEELATSHGFRHIFLNPSDIGGRYSALSLFGLVPAAWMGLDVVGLLNEADEMVQMCRSSASTNPAALLGATVGESALFGRDKLTLDDREDLSSFGDWVEQLVAESTGKEDKGVVPVVGEDFGPPNAYGEDRLFINYGSDPPKRDANVDLGAAFRLGAEMFRFEFAVAVAGAVMGINPFDQPNVAEAKEATAQILNGGPQTPDIDDLGQVLDRVGPSDYITLQAYLHRDAATEDALQSIRLTLRDRYKVATTVGFGPRFLHSTGQLHKGGPNSAVCIQIVDDEPPQSVAIPGAPYGFDGLIDAQALGDLLALQRRGRRVTRTTLEQISSAI